MFRFWYPKSRVLRHAANTVPRTGWKLPWKDRFCVHLPNSLEQLQTLIFSWLTRYFLDNLQCSICKEVNAKSFITYCQFGERCIPYRNAVNLTSSQATFSWQDCQWNTMLSFCRQYLNLFLEQFGKWNQTPTCLNEQIYPSSFDLFSQLGFAETYSLELWKS